MFELDVLDVGHGQSVVVKLPNGAWCIFDAGSSDGLSPVAWIRSRTGASFQVIKATFSHLHNDHIQEWRSVLAALPQYLQVNFDAEYLKEVRESSADPRNCEAIPFVSAYSSSFGPALYRPDYGVAQIREWWHEPSCARHLGSAANSHVNNASIVSRLDCYGNAILICGDMEQEGWEWALGSSQFAEQWKAIVSGIDVLVAPHHGHASGFSSTLMRWARPRVVLASVVGGDESVDTRYSSAEFVSGITVNGSLYRCMTTRTYGTLRLRVAPPATTASSGQRSWPHLVK